MDIKFLSTVAVITPDPPASRRLYLDTLALPLEGDEYLHSEQLAGCKSFGIWPLFQAAEACFWNITMADRPADTTDQSRVRRRERPISHLSGTRARASRLRAAA